MSVFVGIICFVAGAVFGFIVLACVTAGIQADERAERKWEMYKVALRYGAHMPPNDQSDGSDRE